MSNWVCKDLEAVTEALNELIPMNGCVTNPVKNRKLEQYRVAQNVVHDIFNNGLMNMGKSLKCLKVTKHELCLPYYMPSQDYYYQGDWAQIADKVEPEMRRKILLAAEEQGIKVEFVTELEAA